MNYSTKSLALLGACGALTLCVPLRGTAQVGQWYVKADLGGNLTQNTDLQEFFGPVAPGSKVKFDPGLRAGGAVGYNLADWFSPEAELGFMGNHIDSITGATRLHDVSFANVPFLVNARFQWPNETRFVPYIGAGVGFSEAILDVDRLTISNPGFGETTLHGSDADTVFAYQAFAGVRYLITDRMGLSLEYRYFATESPSWQADVAFAGPASSDTVRFGHIQTHSLSLAFSLEF